MPYKSAKQRRYVHAAAAGKVRKGGMTRKAAKKFIAHSKPKKRKAKR